MRWPLAEDTDPLRSAEVSQLVGLSRSSIYQLKSERRFPESVEVGSRSVRLRMADVLAWRHRWIGAAGLCERDCRLSLRVRAKTEFPDRCAGDSHTPTSSLGHPAPGPRGRQRFCTQIRRPRVRQTRRTASSYE